MAAKKSEKRPEEEVLAEIAEANPWVYIRRQWNDWRKARVRLKDLHNLRWDDVSGGVYARAPQPFIHGYVWCDRVHGELAHSCLHGEGPHWIKVCVVKRDNEPRVFKILQLLAEGKKLGRETPGP